MRKIDRQNVENILSLSPGQEGILLHFLSNPESEFYFEELSVNLTFFQEIDLTAFRQAWETVLEVNQALRTVFAWEKLDKPVQIILKKQELPLSTVDFSQSVEKDALLADVKARNRQERFNLQTGPLFRVTLCKMAEKEYELIISYSHLISDGWSNGVILQDFREAYSAFAQGLKPVKRVKTAISEYTKWRQQRNMQAEREFWQRYLQDFTTKTLLPLADKQKIGPAASHLLTLPAELAEGLTRCANQWKVTPAVFFYTAWGLLLANYNNSTDVVFGATTAGRPTDLAGVENMVGLFVNTLPLRIKSGLGVKVHELLQNVNTDLQQRLKYEYLSLGEVKALSDLAGQESLFDSAVVVENYPLDLASDTGLFKLNRFSMEEMTEFPLTLIITDFAGYELKFGYQTASFSEEMIARLCGYYLNLLTGLVKTPEAEIRSLDMLTAEEKELLCRGFNDAAVRIPEPHLVQELFGQAAEKYAARTALVFESQEMTYQEFERKTNQLAQVLRQQGVQRETVVGIMLQRSFEMCLGIMAVLKAGGAYLPIDPNLPEERITFMLEDSGVRLLLTQSQSVERAEAFGIAALDLAEGSLYSGDASRPVKVNEPKDLAYIIYTSGSTGKPKGVMVEHASIVNTLSALQTRYPLGADDAYLLKTAYTFDVSLAELFGWFFAGGKLVILPPGAEKDPKAIVETIVSKGVTHLNFVPSMFSAFLYALDGEGVLALQRLKYIFLAGEALVYELVKRCPALQHTRLENLYGPTEAAIYAAGYSISEYQSGNVPIGKPLANVQLYILDAENRLKPVGFPGELCIAGAGLARGYLNRPELNEEKFVPHPEQPGQKLYRTGDLARWLPDGNIEYLGRLDHQVKIRGFRIELGEIEAQLLSHPHVKEAAVLACLDQDGEKYLCAYLVPDGPVQTTDLKTYLLRKLPEYMVPQRFIELTEMPLTASGKLNRQALPEPAQIRTGILYVPPVSETEVRLAAIWSELLGLENPGIDDDFFTVGGHSLKGVQLTARILKEWSVEIPLKELFTRPTIKAQARYIDRAQKGQYEEIPPVEAANHYPVSSAQKRMYLLGYDGSTHYNMPAVLEIEGSVDEGQLFQVITSLVERHESLRTAFSLINGEVRQTVHPRVQVELKPLYGESLQAIIGEFIQPFDLSAAPLFRSGLYQAEGKSYLLFDMHHIISDGVSMEILISEFIRLCRGEALKPLQIQYKDYTAWQKSLLESGKIQQMEAYWLAQFSGEIPVLQLPLDKERPEIADFTGGHVLCELDEIGTAKLKELSLREGVTLHMLLLAAYNILLAKYTEEEDIVVGSVVSGRQHPDLENIVGMFVNTLPLRNYPVGSKSFQHFLQEVKENTLRAYANQDYQFDLLVEKLALQSSPGRTPLFDVLLAFREHELTPIHTDGLTITPHEIRENLSKFDLMINVTDRGKTLGILLEYKTALFNQDTVERFGMHFLNILHQIMPKREIKLAEIDMLSAAEKELLLEKFNATQRPYPADKTIHQIFKEKTAEAPDKIAVVIDGQKLTYRELDDLSDEVAYRLQKSGVAPGEIVGIMSERGLDMIAGIMGILKAGAAYLALDINLPTERLNYMLSDSGVRVVLGKRPGDFNGEVISLQHESKEQKERPELVGTSADLAYIIYTSGSTGQPKGVMIEHQAVVNTLLWNNRFYDLTSADAILQLSVYTFDASVEDIFATLLAGAKLVLVNQHERLNLQYLQRVIEENSVTHILVVPGLYRTFLAEIPHSLKKLKQIVLGGDAIPEVLVKEHFNLLPEVKLYNAYGPTENSICTAVHPLSADGEVLIGRPIDNTKCYVLSQANELKPIGVAGELCVSGVGLARSYLHQPELTAAKFVPNPYSGELMYRTGDLAQWTKDGRLKFLGRIDHQVKIRGNRVEIGEIEARLLTYPALKVAVVLDFLDDNGDKYLEAFYVADEEVSPQTLRAHLAASLPAYMIPAGFVQIEAMPYNMSGKIDRKALAKLAVPQTGAVVAEESADEVESQIIEIWQEILHLPQINLDDNIFEMGGQSLTAITMVARIYKVFGVELPLNAVFDAPTIRQLAKTVKAAQKTDYVPLEKAPELDYYPLSSAQKRLFILNQLEGNSTNYNIFGLLEAVEGIDPATLRGIFQELIKRHEVLRTSFTVLDGQPVQIVHSEVDFQLAMYKVPEAELQTTIQSFIQPFQLDKAPLLRGGLIMAGDRTFIIYDLHHIVADGASMSLLTDDFIQMYEGKVLGDLHLQYKDFAVWQEKYFQSEKMQNSEKYWLDLFSGPLPVLNLLTDEPRPAVKDYLGATSDFVLSEELTASLKDLSSRHGATLFMTLLAAYAVLLTKYADERDIVIASPVVGRPHADLAPVVGMFANTLPFRVRIAEEQSFTNLLNEVKEMALQAFDYQDYPLERLVDKLKIERHSGRNPLFDVMFILKDTSFIKMAENKYFKPYELENGVAKMDLTLVIVDAGEVLNCNIEYATSLFNQPSIVLMKERLITLLSNLVANPQLSIADIDFKSAAEKELGEVEYADFDF